MLIFKPHEFFNVYCAGCGKTHAVIIRCGDRFCPVCQVGRRFQIRERLQYILKNYKLVKGEQFSFLTLTIKNQVDLARMVSFLIKSFRKLRSKSTWKRYVSGGAYVIEITGYEGNWHAHLHCIIAAYWFPQVIILKLWRSIVNKGGAHIKPAQKDSTIRYLLKYISKTDSPPLEAGLISDTLKGYRLYQPFGLFVSLLKNYRPVPLPCPYCGCTSVIPEHKVFGVPFLRCIQVTSERSFTSNRPRPG